ncbi:Mor transcription activator family protein [Clostridium botulinum]|uniref:Mor transcription activator family protein n=1 Tax=Clostridium botulinum TaxID=1491 RepID=A0ABC8CQ68_CLOBO|nr:Mor transcription activator family protein [Clostridium botulinum]AVQ37753.1 Mor transcription activator family protein [Clostridium botulinum]
MKFNSSDFNGIYADMYECLGEQIVREINKHYKGQQITFPMRLYSREYVIRYISEKYDGKNIKELARELEYSERWIKKLIDNSNIKLME